MKEVKVFVDGKEVKSIDDLVFMFVDNDIPEPYKNASEYLNLEDLNTDKIINKETFDDFFDKIQKRIKYAREHKEVLTDQDYNELAKIYFNEACYYDYQMRAAKVLNNYYFNLNEIYKSKHNKKNED